jgi:hypothetical protein
VTAPYAPGDVVSLEAYDRTNPPKKRHGTGTVLSVSQVGRACESGWMVALRTPRTRRIELDAGWLEPAPTQGAQNAPRRPGLTPPLT